VPSSLDYTDGAVECGGCREAWLLKSGLGGDDRSPLPGGSGARTITTGFPQKGPMDPAADPPAALGKRRSSFDKGVLTPKTINSMCAGTGR